MAEVPNALLNPPGSLTLLLSAQIRSNRRSTRFFPIIVPSLRVFPQASPDWQNFVAELDTCEDHLSQAWSVVSHMNGVMNSEALRQAYEASIKRSPSTPPEFGHNRVLWRLTQSGRAC